MDSLEHSREMVWVFKTDRRASRFYRIILAVNQLGRVMHLEAGQVSERAFAGVALKKPGKIRAADSAPARRFTDPAQFAVMIGDELAAALVRFTRVSRQRLGADVLPYPCQKKSGEQWRNPSGC